MKTHRAYVYVDLDHVIMEFYKHFRRNHYTSIIVRKLHPLDIDYKSYNTNPKIKSLVDECCADSDTKFWLNVPCSSVGKFYWVRLKKYQDRIYFYTKCRNEKEKEAKLLWLNTHLKMYDSSKLLVNVNIMKYYRSLLYYNILITNDVNLANNWTKLEGIGLYDLGKRSVASYYLERKIITHLEMYPGNNYIAEIPNIHKGKPSKNKDIVSISFEELNNLS